MMQNTAQKVHRYTPEEYLALDRASETKHEYFDGEILAMSGASLNHGVITGNMVGELRTLLRGKSCRIVPNDLRVHIPSTNTYTYTDVVVVCGTPQLTEAKQDTLINPTLIVEVLSPSTERLDRGVKFNKYQQIPTLREYVLVSQEQPFVEVYTHQKGNLWLYASYNGLDAEVSLLSMDGILLTSEIYLNVDFPAQFEEESPS
jgi:Uma2 family endonuclease